MITPARAWHHAPAALAFSLLAFQAAIPWIAHDYVTQDGPSHLYNAHVAKELFLHTDSPYSSFYRFQSRLTTNWSTLLLMNTASFVFGPRHAEHAAATLCVLLGFFGISYLRRSLDPDRSSWTPITNFLLCTWFLWIGFYNFYLGMALLPFVAGYFIRHCRNFEWRHSIWIAAGLMLLFFTHVLAVGLAVMAISVVALWVAFVGRAPQRPWLRVAAALTPALLLLLVFVRATWQSSGYNPQIGWSLPLFPMHAFTSFFGFWGEQMVLMRLMIILMLAAAITMRSPEWRSERGAVFIAAIVSFGFYLVFPNDGFGGGDIKVRFSWAVFLFGCTAASTAPGLRRMLAPFGILAGVLLAITLVHTTAINVRPVDPVVREYLAAMANIPAGSSFIRLRFPTTNLRRRSGFADAALEPLFHTDSLAAAERRLIAISDYQAITHNFPVTLNRAISIRHTNLLLEMEGLGKTGAEALRVLLKEFPLPIDYVVILGDDPPGDIVREFDARMRVVSGPASFVRIYATH